MTDHEHNTQAHEWWRFFGNLRFTQLAFYGVVAGLLLNAQHEGTRTSLQEIKLAGVLITGVVWLMEVSSTLHGIAWKKNAKPDPPTWLLFPFNASNAALVFYALAYRYWWSDLTEHLFIVKISFYILVIWSVFAYLPVWFYSARSFGQTFDTYYRSFLDKAPEPTQEAPNHAHSSSPRDDDSSPDKPRWGFTPLTIAQAGLVLTAIIAFIYYFQLRSMQDSVRLTGLALEADQRPWVKLDYGESSTDHYAASHSRDHDYRHR